MDTVSKHHTAVHSLHTFARRVSGHPVRRHPAAIQRNTRLPCRLSASLRFSKKSSRSSSTSTTRRSIASTPFETSPRPLRGSSQVPSRNLTDLLKASSQRFPDRASRRRLGWRRADVRGARERSPTPWRAFLADRGRPARRSRCHCDSQKSRSHRRRFRCHEGRRCVHADGCGGTCRTGPPDTRRLRTLSAAIVNSRTASMATNLHDLPLIAVDRPSDRCAVGGGALSRMRRNGERRAHERASLARSVDDLAYIIFTSGSTGTPKAR